MLLAVSNAQALWSYVCRPQVSPSSENFGIGASHRFGKKHPRCDEFYGHSTELNISTTLSFAGRSLKTNEPCAVVPSVSCGSSDAITARLIFACMQNLKVADKRCAGGMCFLCRSGHVKQPASTRVPKSLMHSFCVIPLWGIFKNKAVMVSGVFNVLIDPVVSDTERPATMCPERKPRI